MTYLWCLQGNLQTPEVWAELRQDVASRSLKVIPYDVRADRAETFWAWAKAFCDEVASNEGQHLLLGYSLGGRLGLHALLHAPELWAGTLVVGADTGLSSDEAKKARVEWDAAWAKRFLTESWKDVLRDWDAQAVFGGRSGEARAPEDFPPEEVARLFTVFSKGRQDNLLPRLRELTAPPIWYVAGEEDTKYSKLGQQLAAQCPAVSFFSVPDAAHRVPWEAPQAFIELTKEFVQQTAP